MDSTATPAKSASPKTWAVRDLIRRLDLKPITKSTLLVLDDYVNDDILKDTGKAVCWIGQARIAHLVGCDPRSIYTALVELETLGFINREEQGISAGGQFLNERRTINYDAIARGITQTNARTVGKAIRRKHDPTVERAAVGTPCANRRNADPHRRKIVRSRRKDDPTGPEPFSDGRRIVVPANVEPITCNELLEVERHQVNEQVLTSARNADEPMNDDHPLESSSTKEQENPTLENAERSEAVACSVGDQSWAPPENISDGAAIPPAPPIPEPALPTPIPPTPPTWCSEDCGKAALRGDPGRLCADHRAEKQHAAAQRMREAIGYAEEPTPPAQRKPEPCIKQCGNLAEPGSALCVECAKPKDCCEPGCPLPTFAGLDRCIDHQVAFDIAQKRHGSAA